MTADEYKNLELLERLKVQTMSIDISTANSLYEHAKANNEEKLFFLAFVGAISKDRKTDEKNIYSQFFNEINAKAYTKQLGQSQGGKKSKRTKNKPKNSENENRLV